MRQFSGSKVSCMKDYVKPPIRENNLDHIFHVGTNDVPSEKTPQVIAQSIVGLVKTIANDNLQVTISFFKEPQLSTSNKDICFGQHLNDLRR